MRRLSLPLALAVVAGPAPALTPDEVLADWEAKARQWNSPWEVEIERREDGSLLLRNVAPAPPGAPSFAAEGSPLREVVLAPLPDGAVEVTGGMGPRFDLPLDGTAGLALRIEQDGARTLARDGAAGTGIDYDYAAAALRVVLLPPPDRPQDAAAGEFALELTDVTARVPAQSADEGAFGFDMDLTAAGLAYILTTVDPIAGTTTGWSRSEDLSLSLSGRVPASAVAALQGFGAGEPDPADLRQAWGAALADGLAVRIEFGSGPGTGGGSASGGLVGYDYSLSSGQGRFSYEVGLGGLLVSATSDGLALTLDADALPVGPLDLRLGHADAEFRLPLFGATPQEFRYRVALEEAVLGDEAWDALDPGRVLPREPVRFVLDMGGRMALDLFGLVAAAESSLPPPTPRIESVELRELDVAALGARVRGSGAVTLDVAMVPSGAGLLTIEGANRLLDATVALGLFTSQDLVPARMGLAAYFDPGEGEDVLTTRIDVAGSAVTMNGVPLPLD